jgi:methionyl-tRNA formyltransferase
MGRRSVACEGLLYLIEKGVEISVVVAALKDENDHLADLARSYDIPVATDDDLYDCLNGHSDQYDFDLKDVDLVISFLYWKLIKKPLIELPKIGCINFHAAPLPEFRGFSPYSFAIYENSSYYGVTAHFVDECLDTGDIIKTIKFDIDSARETAYSIRKKSHVANLELLKEIVDEVLDKGFLVGVSQGAGRSFSKNDFEKIRKINSHDARDVIDRKIRAFWCPPFAGATVELNGKEYTLINEEIINSLMTENNDKKM